jgi:hypothetical protein
MRHDDNETILHAPAVKGRSVVHDVPATNIVRDG